jgi:hypothetical protein
MQYAFTWRWGGVAMLPDNVFTDRLQVASASLTSCEQVCVCKGTLLVALYESCRQWRLHDPV